MPHPLDGSHFKLAWAQQHLDLLEVRVAEYIATNPYTFPSEVDEKEVRIRHPVITTPPPREIGGIVGDCLNALMASLDYIVWELASKHAGRPLVPPPAPKGDKPSFPLFVAAGGKTGRERFDKNRPRLRFYKIPETAIDLIEQVQPYNAGYEYLASLYFLVNQDKHRLPLLTVGHIDAGDISVSQGGVFIPAVSAADSIAFDPGWLRGRPGEREVHVQTPSLPFVTFDYPNIRREPVQRTLYMISRCVGDVYAFCHDLFA